MIQVSPNVYVESGLDFCNLGIVTTKDGVVMIDTPMNPKDTLKWRGEAVNKGKLRYVVNTEEHLDHCQNSWFFEGVLVSSKETRDRLAKTPVNDIIQKVNQREPESSPLMKGFKLRLADITFSGNLNLHLGDHTFTLFPLVGHSIGGIGVFIPEEKVIFTTDCVFHHFKTWLQEALPEQWLESLKKIGELNVEAIVPGHGAVCKKDYLKEQADIIQKWVEAVKSAIARGLSEEEAIAKITSLDPYPKQPGIPLAEAEINKKSIARLYQLYSGK